EMAGSPRHTVSRHILGGVARGPARKARLRRAVRAIGAGQRAVAQILRGIEGKTGRPAPDRLTRVRYLPADCMRLALFFPLRDVLLIVALPVRRTKGAPALVNEPERNGPHAHAAFFRLPTEIEIIEMEVEQFVELDIICFERALPDRQKHTVQQ